MTRATSLAGLAKPVGNLHRPPGVNLPLGRPAPDFGAGLPCQDHEQYDPNIWFAPDRELGLDLKDAEHAKKLCKSRCPALHECLAWALATGEVHGVWGGMLPQERYKVRRNLRRPA
jgi:WhiB family redox-sensing transcriptional regulator